MKKSSLIFLLLILLQLIVEGQRTGIKGGLDILGADYIYNGNPEDSNPQMGFHVGMTMEFTLSNSFALSAGAIFAEKGFQEDYQLPDKDKTTFFYLDIPALLVYKPKVGEKQLYFQAGPYLGVGLFTNLTGISFEMEKGFGDEPQQYRKTDMGLSTGAGMMFDVWRIGLAYSLGLIDIRNASDTNVRNMVLGFDVTYLFGRQ